MSIIQNNEEQLDEEASIQYELVDKKQVKLGGANLQFGMSLNKEESYLLIIGSQHTIIFSLKDGILKKHQQIVRLQGERQGNNAFFMPKSDSFIQIIDEHICIWEKNKQSQLWYGYQRLFPVSHQNLNGIILVNDDEDLIVDGGTIFYKKHLKVWIQSQTLKTHNGQVTTIKFNQSQNQLVSVGIDKQLIIIQQNSDGIWYLGQTINVDDYGYFVDFLGDEKIIFQPSSRGQLEIFELNERCNMFMKSKYIHHPFRNPKEYNWEVSAFNKKRQIFLFQIDKQFQRNPVWNYHNALGFCRKQKYGDLKMEQTIIFNEACITKSSFTFDGLYLTIHIWMMNGNSTLQIMKIKA